MAELFANVPGTLWMTDERMVVTFLQGKLLRTLGVDPERVVGRSLPDLLLDGREDHPIIHGHLSALGGHETSVRIEWGGRVFSARVGPLRTADGRIVGCVGTHQEIAWLPDDEGTLRESDVRLRRVVDSNMIGIVFGNEGGHITDANDAFLQLAGYARDDMSGEGLSWSSLMPVEAHQRQIQALQEILDTGRCVPFETEIIRKDGERVPVLVGAARLSATRRDGVAFVLNITDRKRTVRSLRAELRCADALADAASLEHAAGQILQVLLVAIGWKSAAVWAASSTGWCLVARDGLVSHQEDGFEALAETILATQAPFWSPEHETLALPLLAAGQCHGVLVLVGMANAAIDAELMGACRRIAGRLAQFIARRT